MISIIIRTLNEETYLTELLKSIAGQEVGEEKVEVIVVDSGSTDRTLAIAKSFGCKMVDIKKEEFSFGRSLNMGCQAASGEYLVFVSGHCVPTCKTWLQKLIAPLSAGKAAYSYGRQLGGPKSKFSEKQLFLKYFPETSRIPQKDFFCNNANAALLKSIWLTNKFNEDLTGLEDMELAKRIWIQGNKVAYCADAGVYHHHDESWKTVRRRYEREAIALQAIMPEIQISFLDFIRYFLSAIFIDFGAALLQKEFFSRFGEIFTFRLVQFWGSYRGNQEHRILSRQAKEIYFYPKSL